MHHGSSQTGEDTLLQESRTSMADQAQSREEENEPEQTGLGPSGDLASRARSAVLWVGSTTVVWQAVSWAMTLLTARILVPDDYGILSLTETVSPFLGMLAALNLTTFIVQTDRFAAHEKAAMMSLTSLVGLGMTILGVSIAPLLGNFFNNPEMVAPFQAVALTFVIRATAVVPLASLQRELDFKPIALMRLVVGITSGLLQLGLAWAGYGYWALIMGILYREVASSIWAHIYVGFPRKIAWDPGLYRTALAFGAPATGALMAAVLFNSSDKMVIGKLFSVEFLGVYSMAFFLTDLPLAKINSVMRPVFLPYFARLRENPERMRDHFRRFVLAVTSVIFPVLVGLAVVAPDAVEILLGEKWRNLARPLQVLCIVALFRSFMDNIPHLLLALGKPMLVLGFRLIYLAVLPASFVAGAMLWGISGIYAAWMIGFPAVSIIVLLILRKEVGISPWEYTSNLAAPSISAGAMGLGTWQISNWLGPVLPPLPFIGVEIAIGATIYLATYGLFFRQQAVSILSVLKRRETLNEEKS